MKNRIEDRQEVAVAPAVEPLKTALRFLVQPRPDHHVGFVFQDGLNQAMHFGAAGYARKPAHRNSNRRLHIGYVSPNFWGHCQALFTAPLFSRHDHQQFEIFCYSDVKSPDAFTARVRDWANVGAAPSP